MDDIRLYFPQLIESDQPIFGHFQFDSDNRVIEHTLHVPQFEIAQTTA